MSFEKILDSLTAQVPKVEVSQAQLDKIEAYVASYVSAASNREKNKELADKTIAAIDIMWDELFKVT